MGWPGVSEDGWISTPLVDHDRIVSDLRNERAGMIAHDETRKHDEGIDRGDEKTPFLEVMNAPLGEVNAVFDFLDPRGLQSRLSQLGLEIGEFFLLDGKEGIHPVGLLRPAVAGLRKEKHRTAIHRDIPVAVGAVGVHIHVGEHQQSPSRGGGILEFEHRFAVVEIVTRQDGVEIRLLAADIAHFEVVEFFEKGRNPCGVQERWQRGKGVGQIRLVRKDVLQRRGRARQLEAKRDFDFVGTALLAVG